MKSNIVEISYTGHNFSASISILPGCVSIGTTPETIKKNIQEAIFVHLAGMKEDGMAIPLSLKGKYQLVYKFETQSLLKYYHGIFTKAALERITGINQRQLSHYSTGLKSPRKTQRDKIKKGLQKLGLELSTIDL